MENEIKDTNNQETAPTAPKKGKSLIQLIKFALVGASNTLVDMIVNGALSHLLALFFSGVWIVYLAKTVGYCCGLLNSYVLNSGWTFREERRRDRREILSFIAVNLVVLLASFGLIYLFRNVLHLNDWWMGLSLPAWLTKIIGGDLFCSLLATCICIPLNFILNKLFVFKRGNTEGKETA